MQLRGHQRGDQSNHKPQSETDPSRDPGRGLFGDFGIVIGKANRAKADGDKKHHPNMHIIKPRPQQS